MRFSSEKIKLHLRACANCGRGIFLRTAPINLYCEQCWSALFASFKTSLASDYPFKVYSLFTWTNFTPQVENLIYSLKGGGLPQAFASLAEQFAIGLPLETEVERKLLVVPPSAREQRFDHAWAWASALGELFGFEVIAPFEFATSDVKPQKRLRVEKRFERQFKLKDGIELGTGRIVFVDDLITSGATAEAAFKALNSPVKFEVWTIARRPKLASI